MRVKPKASASLACWTANRINSAFVFIGRPPMMPTPLQQSRLHQISDLSIPPFTCGFQPDRQIDTQFRTFSPLAPSRPLHTQREPRQRARHKPAPRALPRNRPRGHPTNRPALSRHPLHRPHARKFASHRCCTMQPPGCSHDASLATRGGRAKGVRVVTPRSASAVAVGRFENDDESPESHRIHLALFSGSVST